MKFSILSHASLQVEASGISLLTDPWLRGSCYWRSWWNFPEAPESMIEGLKPDFIYLTHLHWDHFHADSLKYFPKDTPIYIPFTSATRFRGDLADLGFHHVIEMPHGKRFELANGFFITSYQFGFCADSAIVIEAEGKVLLNANDCKLFGLPLKQITDRHPKIDFAFRSHSNASGIPYCIEDYQTRFPEMRSQDDYLEEFIHFALYVGARYAIPFASNHCFLHRDTLNFNATSTSPAVLARRYNSQAELSGISSTCVLMPPGSHWSADSGFQVRAFDYSSKDSYIDLLRIKYDAKLQAQYQKEEATLANFRLFQLYFENFFSSLPKLPIFSKDLKVVFQTQDANGTHTWGLDFSQRKVLENAKLEDAHVLIETPAIVLNDCSGIKMFSVWTASKRLKIRLASNARLKDLQRFFVLLDFFELDCLPLWKNFSWTAIRSRLPRWREAVAILKILLAKLVYRRSFSFLSYFPLPVAEPALAEPNQETAVGG